MKRRCFKVLAIIFSLMVSGCASLKTSTDIAAPAERVWDVLRDLEGYAEWNPFLSHVNGTLKQGQKITLTMRPVGASSREFSPTVVEVSDGRQITWRGRLGLPGLFDGTHHLVIVPIDSNHVTFVQEENFSGMLVPFVNLEPYRQGWERMNAAFKRRCETRS